MVILCTLGVMVNHYHHWAVVEGVRFVMLDKERNEIYDMIEILPEMGLREHYVYYHYV